MTALDPEPGLATLAFIAETRALVDVELGAYFERVAARHRDVAGPSTDLLDAITTLTLRGGKRLRPAIARAAAMSVDESVATSPSATLGASLELFHTSLLAHDDVMDGDVERRSGPSIHAWFRARVGDTKLGESLAILAGDLAAVHSLELFFEVEFDPRVRRGAVAEMLRLREHTGLGQYLDLVADEDLERMRRLKTGSYSVVGPARLGAMLAGADDERIEAVTAWAEPLGEAFQLADDLLGVFGNPERTGKPADDLRRGKLTSVVAEARARCDHDGRAALDALFGNTSASDAEVASLAARLEASGIRASLEARIADRLTSSDRALDAAPLDATGITRLRAIGALLSRRDR